MDKKTAEALEESIKHWEENVAAEAPGDIEMGPKACALCVMFRGKDCNGCPVMDATGERYCFGSPYDNAELICDALEDEEASMGEWRKAATAELDFLKSLRSNPDDA